MHTCNGRVEFIKNPIRIRSLSAPAVNFFIIAGVLAQSSMNKMFAKTKFKILNAF